MPIKKYFPTIIFLLAVLTIGFTFRYYALVNNELILEGDEAIVGLMARHINNGLSNPVFVYGQDYMGSLEAYTAAFFFSVTGQSVKSLKYAPMLYSLLLIFLVYILISLYSGEFAASCAAFFIALPPYLIVKWSLSPTGGHIENFFFSILLLIFIYKYIRQEKNIYLYSTAILSGFAFWVNPFSIFIFAAFSIYYFIYAAESRKKKILVYIFLIALFSAGSTPLIKYNINHGFITFKKLAGFFLGVSAGDYNASANIFLTISKKILFMFTAIFPGFCKLTGYLAESIGNYYFDSIIFMVAMAYYGFKTIKTKDKFGYMILIYILLITLSMSISKRASRDRYLIIFFPAITISFFNIIQEGWNSKKKIIRKLTVAALILILTSSLVRIFAENRKEEINNYFSKINKTIQFLNQKNISYIYADMYIAYPLAFISDEKIIPSPAAGFYNEDRIPEYTEKVLKNNGNTFVFFDRYSSYAVLSSELKKRNISFSYNKIDDFDIIYNLSEIADLKKIPLSLRFKKK